LMGTSFAAQHNY